MAVKKTETKKTSSKSKPEPSPKAAPKKTAPKKGTKAAEAKSTPAVAPKAAAPKAAAKKAPAIKLTDAQTRVLSAVHQTKEAGFVGSKAEAKTLEALLLKKMVKKGKKTANGSYQFLVTKAGAKHVPAPVAPSAPAPVSAPVAAPEASPAPSPVVPS